MAVLVFEPGDQLGIRAFPTDIHNRLPQLPASCFQGLLEHV